MQSKIRPNVSYRAASRIIQTSPDVFSGGTITQNQKARACVQLECPDFFEFVIRMQCRLDAVPATDAGWRFASRPRFVCKGPPLVTLGEAIE